MGYKRVRSVKDAELMLKLRGRLKDQQEITVKGTSRVEIVAPEAIPAIVAEVAARLFAARRAQGRIVDAEEVPRGVSDMSDTRATE